MDWVSPCKTPPVEAILYQGVPCTSPDQLWNALHSTFNSALDRPIDLSVLGDKWESPSIRAWILYSAAEMSDALTGTSNRSAPGPNDITWRHLKCIIRNAYTSCLFLWPVTYSSVPGDMQLVGCWCQWLSSILFRGGSNLQR
jgi:hypothetical protein